MSRRFLPLVVFALAVPLFAAEKPQPPADLTTPPADAERSEDGLVTKRLAEGSGSAMPGPDDVVRVRFTVWKSDGTLVQHVAEPEALAIAVRKMLPGWAAAVQKMVAGERRRAWVPHTLGAGKLAEGESLLFDTELVEIIEMPQTPPDVAAAPGDATTTASGLAYKVLRPGTGSRKPTRRSTVVVHYSGWTTDGKMFDSSVVLGDPVEFPLDAVIKGWTEGVQLMVEGEKTRFWIPARLAYGSDKTKPQGMLVFDVELIAIK